MKKYAIIFSFFVIIPFFISCNNQSGQFPEINAPYLLEIRDDVPTGLRLVFRIEANDHGYTANFSEPEELSDLTVSFNDGTVIIITNEFELPLSDSSSKGAAVIFHTLDMFFKNGVPKDGSTFETDGYLVEIDPLSDVEKFSFTVSDGINMRSFILSKITDN